MGPLQLTQFYGSSGSHRISFLGCIALVHSPGLCRSSHIPFPTPFLSLLHPFSSRARDQKLGLYFCRSSTQSFGLSLTFSCSWGMWGRQDKAGRTV